MAVGGEQGVQRSAAVHTLLDMLSTSLFICIVYILVNQIQTRDNYNLFNHLNQTFTVNTGGATKVRQY